MMKKSYFVIILFCLLLIGGCAGKKKKENKSIYSQIRYLREVQKNYDSIKKESIDYLIKAILSPNRDVRYAAIYYIGKITLELREKRLKKKYRSFSKSQIEEKLDTIEKNLRRAYEFFGDFNTKILSLKILSNYFPKIATFKFVLSSIQNESDWNVITCALEYMSFFLLTPQKYEIPSDLINQSYDIHIGLLEKTKQEKKIGLLLEIDVHLFNILIDNIMIYSTNRELSIEEMKNWLDFIPEQYTIKSMLSNKIVKYSL